MRDTIGIGDYRRYERIGPVEIVLNTEVQASAIGAGSKDLRGIIVRSRTTKYIVAVAKRKDPGLNAEVVSTDVIFVPRGNDDVAISAPFGRGCAGVAAGAQRSAGRIGADMH